MRAIVTLLMVLCFEGCEVTKAKRTAVTDSTSLQKTDSGQVKTTSSNDKKESDWWREIVELQQSPRDCTVNHNYNTYPTRIIREGGTEKQETNSQTYDSSWKTAVDSLTKRIQESSKDKKTEGPSMWQWIGIAIVLLIVYDVVKNYISRIKISIK